jgi:hypothetical protein
MWIFIYLSSVKSSLTMKKILFLVMLVTGGSRLRAQNLIQLKPFDTSVNNLEKYMNKQRIRLAPLVSPLFGQEAKAAHPNYFAMLNEAEKEAKLITESHNTSRMPIAKMEGNSKMPIFALPGNFKMPVVDPSTGERLDLKSR